MTEMAGIEVSPGRAASAAPLEQWAVLELMGHRQAIGRITIEDLAGRPMVRVERIDTEPDGQVQLYGPESVYCLTPVTEQQARLLASQSYRTHTVPPALTAGRDSWDEDDDDDEIAANGGVWGAGDDGAAGREDEQAREGNETGMRASERYEYDRDAEFALDAAGEADDLERAASDGGTEREQ